MYMSDKIWGEKSVVSITNSTASCHDTSFILGGKLSSQYHHLSPP